MDKIIRRLEEQKGIAITITGEAYQQLASAALADLSNGGRGVGNQVEALLINPLSRWLFDHGVVADARVTITSFDTEAHPATLTCQLPDEDSTQEETAHE